MDNEVSTINRREASSGKVSYGDPVIIHETSKSRVILVPFFIPRSSGTDLSIKLVTHRKMPPPASWVVAEEKAISLNEAASRKLLNGLKEHLKVAEEDEDGSYILLRVTEGTASIGEHDPQSVASALVKVLSQEEIVKHLGSTELSDEIIEAFRSVIRLNEMRSAVAQLHQYLENGETSESVFQEWCDNHTWAFGNAYVMRDCVREISPGDQLDLLLPTVIAGYRDIVELKRPDMRVLIYDESHRNYYFSADVSKAMGQCHRYLDVLHDAASNGLRDHPEIVAYHPRAIIVIGRSSDWCDDQLRALHGLNQRLSGVTIMTYDQLLAQGERLVEMISATEAEEETSVEFETWDDDIPF
jgi:hypothetical protein